MTKPITLKPHLTTEELKKRYRSCQKAQEKVRWHALYLISKGVVAAEAARRVGRASSWITSLARRYNEQGATSVERQKCEKPSHRSSIDEQLGRQLAKALEGAAPDGGLWTGVKVAAWIAEQTGREVHRVTGWRQIERLGFTLQTPRPENKRRASEEQQAEFKKT
jgi:transposase